MNQDRGCSAFFLLLPSFILHPSSFILAEEVVNVNPGPSRLRRAVTLLVALVLVGALYLLSQPPTLSSTEAEAIAARFRFEKLPFPEPAGSGEGRDRKRTR